MYYIQNGLGLKWLASIFAIFGALAAFGIGNMVQSNSVADAMKATFNINPLLTGTVLTMAAGLVILGGLKRIASVTEKLVPFMAVFYIIAAVVVLVIQYSEIPGAIQLIFTHAFTPSATIGGFLGASVMKSMRYGVARGVFSNEAGLGSAPIAHAVAKTDHPVKQGLWGIFEVFADTIIICTLTSLTIITTGAWTWVDGSGEQLSGASLTTAAFAHALPGLGGIIVAISILLFAFSTILSWSYYGEKCIEFLFGSSFNKFYRLLFLPLIFIGSISSLDLVWDIADTLNGMMAVPNLIGLLGLSTVVIKLAKDFFINMD